jgi:hypothetical protein
MNGRLCSLPSDDAAALIRLHRTVRRRVFRLFDEYSDDRLTILLGREETRAARRQPLCWELPAECSFYPDPSHLGARPPAAVAVPARDALPRAQVS